LPSSFRARALAAMAGEGVLGGASFGGLFFRCLGFEGVN